MLDEESPVSCPVCDWPTNPEVLAESIWLPTSVRDDLGTAGQACPRCVQSALRRWLRGRAIDDGAEGVSPLQDGRLIPFGLFPVTELLGHDTVFTGRGVTMAIVDSGFYPHPDLTGLGPGGTGRLRLRAWADCSTAKIKSRYFHPLNPPHWPGWSRRAAEQWHGMMTAAVAAGDGRSSHGWFGSYAPESDLVFVQTFDHNRRITNASIARALRWLLKHREKLRLRVVNLSVGGDPVHHLEGNYVDRCVRKLDEAGVLVVVAAGNSGRDSLLPPATAPMALTVGGVDTRNSPNVFAWHMWHSNWGLSSSGTRKPDLLAPSIWVPAPVLPDSSVAEEGRRLFELRDQGGADVEERILRQKFISPLYQHVDGTSFACAIVAGVAASLFQAKPSLTPAAARRILTETAIPLHHVPKSHQGAGVINPTAALRHK